MLYLDFCIFIVEETTNDMGSSIYYLIYVSRSSRPLDQNDFNEIIKASGTNNTGKNISGMLLYIEGGFFQVLEGAKEDVDELYEKIARDERHNNLVVVSSGESDKRIFKDWTMRFNSISEEEFSRLSGISKFQTLFGFKPKSQKNPALIFVKKFIDKKFPSEGWWAK